MWSLILCGINILIFEKGIYSFELTIIQGLILIPIGIVFGLVTATAFHNASHFNYGRGVLNLILSEFCGLYTLLGMRAFRVGHTLHHIHADDPENDPHPPQGLSFFQFIMTSHNRTLDILEKFYYKNFGKSEKTRTNIFLQKFVFKASFFLKIIFWYLFFGKDLFLFFYIPSYMAYFFGFAHLNYISHLPDDDGQVRMKNHSKGPFYGVMNVLTSGGYFHKNHHLCPGLRNPSKLKSR